MTTALISSANWDRQRAARGWASHSIEAAGGRLAFGSDWPVVSLDPEIGLYTAVTRMAVDGTPEGGWHPEQRASLAAAVDAYTSGSGVRLIRRAAQGTPRMRECSPTS